MLYRRWRRQGRTGGRPISWGSVKFKFNGLHRLPVSDTIDDFLFVQRYLSFEISFGKIFNIKVTLCNVPNTINPLTVHRNENGSTIDPTSGSLSTKLELPNTSLLAFPNEHPDSSPGRLGGVVFWYSFRHNRNAVWHCGHCVVLVFRTSVETPQQYSVSRWLFVLEISSSCSSKLPAAVTWKMVKQSEWVKLRILW